MIKKINTLVFVLIGVMIVVKAVLNASKSASSGDAADGFVPAAVRNAEFAPTVHYFSIPGLSLANPMLNRNGYLLDIVRAVFPNSRFDGVEVPSLELCRQHLDNEGDNVMVVTKDFGKIFDLTLSDVVLYNHQIVIYTLRRNGWSYKGPESLFELKSLGIRDDLRVLPAVQKLLGDKLNDRLRVYKKGEAGHTRFSQVLLSGEVEAYMVQRHSSSLSRTEDWGVTGDSLMNLRCSKPVCELPCVLGVKTSDPERSKRLIEAFDRGYREIEQNGELRRIREYYER